MIAKLTITIGNTANTPEAKGPIQWLAVVTAATNGGGPVTGTVTFFVCNPSQVVNGACATGGSQVGVNAVPLQASNPVTTPPSGFADSAIASYPSRNR